MSSEIVTNESRESTSKTGTGPKTPWLWHPDLPIRINPLFFLPIRPVAILRWLLAGWVTVSTRTVLTAFALIAWFYLQPSFPPDGSISLEWLAIIFARNLALIILVAGGLHYYLITRKKQGDEFRYDRKEMQTESPRFVFDDQVWDNVFWAIASGVTFWTCYEVGFIWAFETGLLEIHRWSDGEAWFVAVFFMIPFIQSFHFYWVHRLLHWPPLYRTVHNLHHLNVNTGPWSGMSMHPVEHVVYLSSVLIHIWVPSHPVHVIFHLYWLSLDAVVAHAGYEKLVIGNTAVANLGSFFHQLHHRYFNCNYGNSEIPWDTVFGSFHDGTPEATRRVRKRSARAA
ncbi:MAG: sterol desaturase family protein [Alphaproteobacteria bacterium]